MRLGIHRTIETVVGAGPTMLFGMALVALSIIVMLPVTRGGRASLREDLAFALSIVLLGLLMMVTRRNAVSQVIGFMSLENGLVLAATGARGMPLVVEISVAFSVLIAFIVIGIFLFRIRERFDSVDLQALDMSRVNPMSLPIGSTGARRAPCHPGRRRAATRANPGLPAVATLNTVLSAHHARPAPALLYSHRPEPRSILLVDDLNTVFLIVSVPGGIHHQRLQCRLHRARAADASACACGTCASITPCTSY